MSAYQKWLEQPYDQAAREFEEFRRRYKNALESLMANATVEDLREALWTPEDDLMRLLHTDGLEFHRSVIRSLRNHFADEARVMAEQ